MITVEQAMGLVLGNLPARREEEADLPKAQGRVLAREITAQHDVPPFDRAAMDGFAVRSADAAQAPLELKIAGEVRAGACNPGSVMPGEAKSITTGAPVPEGADAVQMIEQCRVDHANGTVTILRPMKACENVVPRGAEAARGSVVLEAGRRIGPAELAVLATFGFTSVPTYKPPRVALISTGDELVEVGREPRPGQIRNSNSYSLSGQLRLLGLEAEYLGIAPDEPSALRTLLSAGLERDIVILAGGVSMGDYDFVKPILAELGIEILFAKVAMKPGKPTVFGRSGDKLVFGLPGNPVSTFVAFENFVRPAIGRLCGLRSPDLMRISGRLGRSMRQTPGRTAFLPALSAWKNGEWLIEPLAWKGSGDIIGFSGANSMVVFPAEAKEIPAGDPVEALLLPDFLDRRLN